MTAESYFIFVVETLLPLLIFAVLLGVVVYVSTYLALRNFFGGKSWDEVRD
jgi:hypothetical protein